MEGTLTKCQGKVLNRLTLHHIQLHCSKKTILKEEVVNGRDLTIFLHPNYAF